MDGTPLDGGASDISRKKSCVSRSKPLKNAGNAFDRAFDFLGACQFSKGKTDGA
ncbi:MAG: hypothetical protein JWL90_995, partial [Chthoniobacteraceae bacterium]|nr:hypothetical protein [Chthoniobacteraceae bacterium]